MTLFLTTYDLASVAEPHTEFLSQAPLYGWQLWIRSDTGVFYRLPNTTLTGEFATRELAVEAFNATVAATEQSIGMPVVLEKWIVTECVNATFNSDVKQRG